MCVERIPVHNHDNDFRFFNNLPIIRAMSAIKCDDGSEMLLEGNLVLGFWVCEIHVRPRSLEDGDFRDHVYNTCTWQIAVSIAGERAGDYEQDKAEIECYITVQSVLNARLSESSISYYVINQFVYHVH